MQEQSKHNKTCIKCDQNFIWYEKEAWWDYSNFTNVKLIKCSSCGCIQAVKYNEPHDVNHDKRYYEYKSPKAI